jgi:hypothetical protein
LEDQRSRLEDQYRSLIEGVVRLIRERLPWVERHRNFGTSSAQEYMKLSSSAERVRHLPMREAIKYFCKSCGRQCLHFESECVERDTVSVRITERELVCSSVRIEVWLLFEPTAEGARSLKRQVEIIDTEKQQETIAGRAVTGAN